MRQAVIVLLMLAACADKKLPTVPDTPAPQPLELLGKWGAAHACPVDGKVVTAGHVAYAKIASSDGLKTIPKVYIIKDGNGNVGEASPASEDSFVDVAVLETTLNSVSYYQSGAPPAIGDEVRWTEYDFRETKHAYHPRERRATVVALPPRHIVFSETPTPGASGSCLFSSAGDVVGIISWRQTMIVKGSVGVAVGIVR